MFCKYGEKRGLYNGKYKPLITDWKIVRSIKGGEPVEVENDLIQRIQSLPFSDVPGIEFSGNYRCRIEGRVFGHSVYPYEGGTDFITSDICVIRKLENATDVVLVITRTNSAYYLSLK